MITFPVPPVSDIAGVMTYTVTVPMLGTPVSYEGKYYELLGTTTYQGKAGEFSTNALLLEVDDEGNDAGASPITVNLDTPGIEAV